ncbi:MAG: substrate-binding domain-containing protein [Spirochaetaceae bacterium]
MLRGASPFLTLLLPLLALMLLIDGCAEEGGESRDPWRVVFVPAIEDPFYRAIGAGAAEAAKSKGIEFDVAEYPQLWSADAQRKVLEAYDLDGVDALLIGPTSTVALQSELKEIAYRGIALITVDTYVGDGNYSEGDDQYALSYVGTDNWNGGKAVAERLAELVGKEGAVYVNTTHSDVSSVADRVDGFMAGMAEFPNMQVIARDYNEDRQDVAYRQTLQILQKHPEVRAIFATNLFSSQGAYQAVLETGLTGAVRIASWDSTGPIVEALTDGFIDLVLAQSPREIGVRAVELASDHLEGRPVPRKLHVSARILSQESLDSEDLEELTY